MLRPLRISVTGLATLAAALVCGFFYAYDCSVMVGFAAAEPQVAIAAMQSINATVRNLPFAFSFFGTLGLGLLAAILALRQLNRPATAALWLGVALYGLGGFGVTMLMNVPLNVALAGVVVTPETAAMIWRDYAEPWQFWNAVRMLASGLALVAFVTALILEAADRQRRPAA